VRDGWLALGSYFGKFAVVGASGIVVNQGCLALLTLVFGVAVKWAGAIAIELSILNNFLLNNFWTWRDRRQQPFWRKLLKYHLVTSVSGGVNYAVLLTLTHFGMHALVANLVGIGLGMVINFLLNHFWTFRV